MADVAALGFSVDSSALLQGATALDKLALAADRAGDAAGTVGPSVTNAATAINKVSVGANAAATGIQKITTAATASTAAINATAVASGRAAASMSRASVAVNALAANQNKLSGSTGNMAAQFQDIAVSLQGGQSWLNVALQQGTQLGAVLNTVEGGAKGVGGALAGAFASVISPVNLATIGVIALAGAAYQYFTAVDDGTDDAAVALKKHSDMIDGVVKKWGDALPTLKAYNDELKLAQGQKDVDAATGEAIAKTWVDAKAAISDANIALADVQLMLGSGYEDQVRTIGDAFAKLQQKVMAGTATSEDAKKVQDALSSAYAETGIPAVNDMAMELTKLHDALDDAASKTANLRVENEALAAQQALAAGLQKSTLPLEEYQKKLDEGKALTDALLKQQEYYRKIANPVPDMGQIPIPGRRPDGAEGIDANSEPGGAKVAAEVSKTAEAYDKLAKAQQESIERLRLEANLIGATATERATAIAKLETEQKLRAANIDLSSQNAQALLQEADAAARLKLQVDQMSAGWQTVQNAGMSAIDQLTASIGDMDASAKDIAQNLANTLLAPLKELAIANPLKNAIYGTNLPTFESIGGLGGFMGALSGQKAPPLAGAPTVTSTTAMTVTAGTVMVNGGVMPGGIPSIPGLPGASTTGGLGALLGYTPGAAGITPANSNVPAAMAGDMSMWKQAISSIESGSFAGNYGALGPVTNSGDRAYGRYQVMGNNIPSWSEKYVGERLTPSQYLANPAAQDKVFEGEFGSYASKYGPAGAANKWFTGSATPTGRADITGTTDTVYTQKFNAAMSNLSSTTSTASENVSTLGDSSTNVASTLTDTLGSASKLGDTGALSSSFFPAAPAMPTSAAPATGGIGSIFSSLFSSIGSLFGFADGGYTGAGGKHQPAGIVHRGEFVVNSGATSRFLPMLNAMNSGKLPGFAEGGFVGSMPSVKASPENGMHGSGKSGIKVQVETTVDPHSGNIKSFVKNIVQEDGQSLFGANMERYDREHLPRRIQEISRDSYASG